jgi:tetratricopeptide (TPR) repeat protein
MQRRFRAAALVAVVVTLGVAASGCGYVNMLKGRQAVKEAYTLYQQQNYRAATAKFEEAIALNPDEKAAYFYLANSYDNLYKPSRRGEAENDGFLSKAVEYYRKAADVDPDTKMRKLALEYLVSAYGPDKLDDPSQAEPLVKRMIELEPKEPGNYYVLAKMYEDSGQYELAEQTFLAALEARPNDGGVLMQLASYYNRLGEFDKTMRYLKQRADADPNNPDAHYTIATFYWDKQFRDPSLSKADKLSMVKAGLEAIDTALKLNPEYADAYVYKGLLLRAQAQFETDPARFKSVMSEAEALGAKGQELKKRKAGGQ